MRRTLILLAVVFIAVTANAAPETVVVTYRFAPENEAALRKVIDGHWTTLTNLQLVTGPHQLYRGSGFYLEIFTWKDGKTPDAAPAEVTRWWKEMGDLVTKGGLRIEAVEPVAVP